MKRVLISAGVLIAVGAFLLISGAFSNGGNSDPTYKIELDNSFGLVNGADFKVAGARAGKISQIDLCQSVHNSGCQNPLHALVTAQITESGFGSFRSDAFCQSRPQSLIGEYYVDCAPGQYGKSLKPGSTIPVTHTQSTIPADLVQNIMRMPYRQRFSFIINELGAAVASRSDDLQSALHRAVPALTQTDNLLNLLANDAHTIQHLNVNADAVITALANDKGDVQRFIDEANKAASESASPAANSSCAGTTQANCIQASWHKLPGFLEQLRPGLQKLGAAADAQVPVFQNLDAAANNLHRFFTDLVPFSNESLPSLRALGQASVTGKSAVQAAGPAIQKLNNFTGPENCSSKALRICTPELAQNLAIVLRDIDSRNRASEPDRRSPSGQGYTGLEALLQYVFNQTLSINAFGPWSHMLTVDAFFNQACGPYATPQTLSQNLEAYKQGREPIDPRTCYSWTGPQQPGINVTDPSNPGSCVPDPGGHPPGYPGASNGAPGCTPSSSPLAASDKGSAKTAQSDTGSPSASTASSRPRATIDLHRTLGQISSAFGGGGAQTLSAPAPGAAPAAGAAGAAGSAAAGGSGAAADPSSGGQTQQLLNYLLAP